MGGHLYDGCKETPTKKREKDHKRLGGPTAKEERYIDRAHELKFTKGLLKSMTEKGEKGSS